MINTVSFNVACLTLLHICLTTPADASMAAMHRVPFAQQEVHRLRGDVSALRTTAASLLSSVHHDRSAAAATIAPLASLHRAKTNMEGACETLKEATELSGAFRRVEDVFAAGKVCDDAHDQWLVSIMSGYCRILLAIGYCRVFPGILSVMSGYIATVDEIATNGI